MSSPSDLRGAWSLSIAPSTAKKKTAHFVLETGATACADFASRSTPFLNLVRGPWVDAPADHHRCHHCRCGVEMARTDGGGDAPCPCIKCQEIDRRAALKIKTKAERQEAKPKRHAWTPIEQPNHFDERCTRCGMKRRFRFLRGGLQKAMHVFGDVVRKSCGPCPPPEAIDGTFTTTLNRIRFSG